MAGIRPVRFEPVPSWCTGGSVVSSLCVEDSFLHPVRHAQLCLLFCFEGADLLAGCSPSAPGTNVEPLGEPFHCHSGLGSCTLHGLERWCRPLRTAEQARASLFFQATKSQRWMPWRQEPMKDVGDCEKPRGAVYLASIRGCPNGETQHSSWSVTLV